MSYSHELGIVAIGLQKNSIFHESLNSIAANFRESGIVPKLNEQMNHNFSNLKMKHLKSQPDFPLYKLIKEKIDIFGGSKFRQIMEYLIYILFLFFLESLFYLL